jgi:hypothetical protein
MQHISLKKILLASTAVVTLAISAGNNTAVASMSQDEINAIFRASPTQLLDGLEAQNVVDIGNAGNLIPVAPGGGLFAQTIEDLRDRVNPASATLDAALVTVENTLNAYVGTNLSAKATDVNAKYQALLLNPAAAQIAATQLLLGAVPGADVPTQVTNVNGRLGGAAVDTETKLLAIEAQLHAGPFPFNTDIVTTVTQFTALLNALAPETLATSNKLGAFPGATTDVKVDALNAILKADPAPAAETTFEKVNAIKALTGPGAIIEDDLTAIKALTGAGATIEADITAIKDLTGAGATIEADITAIKDLTAAPGTTIEADLLALKAAIGFGGNTTLTADLATFQTDKIGTTAAFNAVLADYAGDGDVDVLVDGTVAVGPEIDPADDNLSSVSGSALKMIFRWLTANDQVGNPGAAKDPDVIFRVGGVTEDNVTLTQILTALKTLRLA